MGIVSVVVREALMSVPATMQYYAGITSSVLRNYKKVV
jgi:hypothetical protein